MAKFTHQHYVPIAELLKDRRAASRGTARRMVLEITVGLADLFSADNPGFKRDLFYDAAGVHDTDRDEHGSLPHAGYFDARNVFHSYSG